MRYYPFICEFTKFEGKLFWHSIFLSLFYVKSPKLFFILLVFIHILTHKGIVVILNKKKTKKEEEKE